MFLSKELLDLLIHFLLLVLIKVYTIDSIDHDVLVPVVIFYDFNYFLLLVRTDDWKNLSDNHFDESWVVLNKLILELMLIQRGGLSALLGSLQFLAFLLMLILPDRIFYGFLVLKIGEFLFELSFVFFESWSELLELNIFFEYWS